MREELGPNICAYSESELAQALKNRPPVRYYVKHGTSQEPGHIGLSSKSTGRVKLRWDHEYGTLGELLVRRGNASREHLENSTGSFPENDSRQFEESTPLILLD
jgi:hypothetical protein